MTVDDLIADLSKPEAFGRPGVAVEVIQTHISVVFLVGQDVFKIKKSLDLGFLDFSTLEKRRHYCHEEVRLNARLAPDVYLGVCPVRSVDGRLRIDTDGRTTSESTEPLGDVLEYAVHMRRLPDASNLHHLLASGQLDSTMLDVVAERLSQFHGSAARSEEIQSYGSLDVVAGNARENFEQTREHVGSTVTSELHERAESLCNQRIQELAALIEDRARRGLPCDTHGDLRLDHVYVVDVENPAAHLQIIDCIEFNERFRYADPLADAAFLIMDLEIENRSDLAQHFAEAFLSSSGEASSVTPLLRFYVSYRSIVRAKVEGLKACETEVPAADRAEARRRSRSHWLLGLRFLARPSDRPALVLVGGLPGTGKSTLSRNLAETAGFEVLRTDVVRKELFGASSDEASMGGGIYSEAHTRQTYDACRERAEEILARGGRVLIDASFAKAAVRESFDRLARELAVPTQFFVCQTSPEVAKDRIEQRVGDASDATPSVHDHLRSAWDPVEASLPFAVIDTSDSPANSVSAAVGVLVARGLSDGDAPNRA